MRNSKNKVAVYEGHMMNRLKAFTDCIMSIIATIMVLNIPLPKGRNLQNFAVMITPMTVFVVSFFVIMAIYFGTIKVFAKMHRISGLQILVYTFFLLLVSIFPLLTRVETSQDSSFWFLVVYVVYVVVISRGEEYMLNWFLRFNDEPDRNIQFARGSGWLVFGLFLFVTWLGYPSIAGIFIIWFPVRSLIKSIVIAE